MERFDLRVTNKKFELININYLKDTSLEYQSNIKEDVSNSIFKSSITNLEENQFSNLHTSIINKLFQ